MTIKQQGGIFGRNPTYNDVTVDGSVSVDTISEKTSGSGVTIDGFQAINGGAVASANSPKIEISSANANGYNYRLQSTSTGFFTLSQQDGSVLTGDGTILRYNTSGYFDVYQNLAMANGKGIDFSATSGTGTSELFSDYEEGTWTPVISDGTNNGTSNVAVGTYIKTGNHVHVQGRVRLSSLGSVSGSVRLTGLPFNSKTLSNNFCVMVVGRAAGLNVTAGQAVYGDLRANVDYVNLIINDATVGTSNLQDTEFTADGDISFSMDYISN